MRTRKRKGGQPEFLRAGPPSCSAAGHAAFNLGCRPAPSTFAASLHGRRLPAQGISLSASVSGTRTWNGTLSADEGEAEREKQCRPWRKDNYVTTTARDSASVALGRTVISTRWPRAFSNRNRR